MARNCSVVLSASSLSADIDKISLSRAIHNVETKAWPEEQCFTLQHIVSHLEVFPRGVLLAFSGQKELSNLEPCAWGLVEVCDYKWGHALPSWLDISDEGFIRNSHNPAGAWIYGVNLSVPRGVPSGTAANLLDAAKDIARDMGKKGILLGARIPRYYKSDLSVHDYVRRGEDPGLLVYTRRGFEVFEEEDGSPCVIPDYFDDPLSKNYGVLMVWRNHNQGRDVVRSDIYSEPIVA